LRRIKLLVNRDDVLRLDGQLCFVLHAASRALTQAYAPLLEPLGLTYPQYVTMLALWEEDGATIGRIGQRLFLDSGTVTPLVKRLAAMGLVERRRSQADERVVHVHLTPAGRRLRTQAEGIPGAMFCATKLSPGSAERLGTELRRLLAALTSEAAVAAAASPPTTTPATKPTPKKESQS
jgi:DNA-binding MarR family transcriptional regulator